MSEDALSRGATVHRQRLTGTMLVLLQLMALGWASGLWAFSTVGMVLAVAPALLPAWRFRPSQDGLIRLSIGVMLAVYVWHRFSPPEFSLNRNFLGTSPFACSIARSLIALQLLLLLVEWEDGRLPQWFCGPAAGAMVFAFDIVSRPAENMSAQLLAIGFLLLLAMFFATSRRTIAGSRARTPARSLLIAGVLVLTAGSAWAASALLQQHERDLEQLVRRLMMMDPTSTTRTGFSGRASLGSVNRRKGDSASTIALRVEGGAGPQYLRGAAFNEFSGHGWQSADDFRQVVPRDFVEQPAVLSQPLPQRKYPLAPANDASRGDVTTRLVVWPGDVPADVLFSPLRADAVEVVAEQVSVSRERIVRATGHPEILPWTLQLPAENSAGLRKHDDQATRQLLQLPHVVHGSRELASLAKQVFADADTVQGKVDAVTEWLGQHHRYSTTVHPPPDASPILWFLLTGQDAHCEYFATAAAVLLRTAGVPARYVTGYVAAEKNPLTGEWLARHRDAHAWVEALDDSGRWVTVEATPPDGQPRSGTSGPIDSIRDSVAGWWQWMQAAISQQGFVGGLVLLVTEWWQPVTIVMITLIVIGTLRQWLRRRPFAAGRKEENPLLSEMHRCLELLDESARRAGYERAASETLHEFARRLERGADGSDADTEDVRELAAGYRRYAGVRYCAGQSAVAVAALVGRLTVARG